MTRVFAIAAALIGAASGAVLLASPVAAQLVCQGGGTPTAEVISVDGTVSLLRAGTTATAPRRGDALCPGDEIVTGDASAIDIRFASKNSVTNILSSSTVIIPRDQEVDIALNSGLMRFLSSVSGVFRIRTPHTDAGIDGTEALVAVDGPQADTLVLVREGVVTVSARDGSSFPLAQGEASYASAVATLTRATPDNVPQKFRGYLLNPEGAADWAVYYPPVLLAAGVTDSKVLRAAELLDAGQPDEADRLLATYAGPDAGAALALRSVAAVFRNRVADGVALADQAVAAAPGLGAAHVAQSYAAQASGDIDAALVAARSAVQASPGDAYAWARLGEVSLTAGDRAGGRDAAARSLSLAETALGHAVTGFSLLSDTNAPAAQEAFESALAIDSEEPLAHLGLGLSRIKQGSLEDGRLDLEAAASLNPQRAAFRGWLGRAYLEGGLDEKAAAQFQLAQEQDPDDPSPWFFSAQERFKANSPIEALDALQNAQERAEGRATVRSRSGLGEDQAVRDTAAGRIFDVLGFESQAALAGANAVAADPTNPGSHRFLADVYRARPGFEIAVSSELLSAQLLSPPSKNPAQPRLSEPDLALLSTPGAARVSFHEFAPIFDGDGAYFIGSVSGGTQGTFEDEISLSILDENVSLAIGQFHSSTDGFRSNDDVRHEVVSVEAKVQVTPWLTLTGEVRGRETVQGDRFLRSFQAPTTIRTETEEERIQFMLGGHAELSPSNDLLFFGVIAETDEDVTSSFVDPFFGFPINSLLQQETGSLNFEIKDIHQFGWGNVQAGASYGMANTSGGFVQPFAQARGADVEQLSGFVYVNAEPLDWVDVTLGVSVDHAERTDQLTGFDAFFNSVLIDVDRDFTQINPKVGLEIEPIDGFVVRGAYAKTLKRELVQDRTLEPTTIAGFNQFFDDFEQTESTMLGGGVDIQILDNLWLGGEYVYRDLGIPDLAFNPATFNSDVPIIREGKERTVRGYLNATLGPNWAGSVGVEFSKNETELLDRPDTVETLLVPASVSYFHNSGVFATAEAIYVDQSSTGQAQDQATNGLLSVNSDEQALILNATLGYRFPNGRGVAALEVNNILDQDISLQNSLNNSARPSTRPIAESLSVIGRVTLGF